MSLAQRSLSLAAFLGSIGATSGAAASKQQLTPLQRVTVGPFDNYQGTVDAGEKQIYFTRAQNLSSQLMRLDLGKGLSTALTPQDADAKSPSLSPDGKTLAFTYFKFDAKGDICVRASEGDEEGEIRCITKAGEVDQNPFWIDAQRLAYVSSNDAGNVQRLQVYDFGKKASEQLLQGSVYSPALAPSGREIVYKGKSNELLIYDLGGKKVSRTLQMSLPGASGPARFSPDGRYLYFAQYIVDSNRDLVLDARDAAAIYRIDLQQKGDVLPEQLTSLQQNCSEPFPAAQHLYMTCAFEGALDIYRSPLSGTVPSDWKASDLWEAHMAARSYADRVLLLNHLATRFKAMSEAEANERNLMNFVLMGAFKPAQFYAQKLAADASYPAEKRSEAAIQDLLLETYARWEVLPQKRNLGQFAELLRQQEKKLDTFGAQPMAQLSRAYFAFFANRPDDAKKTLSRIKSEDATLLYWQTQLEAKLERDKNPEAYRRSLASRVLRPQLGEQTRLYYLALWLEELKEQEPEKFLGDFGSQLANYPAVKELIENEQDLYRHRNSPDRKAQNEQYKKIVERVKRIRSDYFSLRLLFNRSLISMARAKQTKDMADIVGLWVSYLKRDTKEFPYAIEAMRRNNLDVAYRLYHAKGGEKSYAAGAFYTSLRATDDLESHFQYALLNLDAAKWKELEAAYKMMIKDGMIRKESLEFVRNVKNLQKKPSELEVSDLEETAQVIETIPEDYVGLGTKFLLLGYLYQMQMIKTQEGFKFDRELADKAHRAYLFAIDAAYANDRIMAAALQNIAALHLSLRNFSLAAEFFARRQDLPMNSPAQATANLWLMASAMYRSYRATDALAAIDKALSLKPEPRAAFLEKKAFYAWNAQNYPVSVAAYEELLALNQPLRASIYLSYGYALRGVKRWADAETALKKAISLAQQEKASKKTDGPALVYQPIKVRFTALGLLARSELPPAKQRAYLEQRLALFPEIISQAKILHFSEETLSSQQVKETQDLAQLQAAEGKATEALATLLKSLGLTQKHGEDFGYLAHTVLISSKNAMLLAQDKKWQDKALDAQLQGLIKATEGAYKELKNPGGVVTQKWGELRLIYAAYELRQASDRRERFAAAATSMLGEETFQNLAKDQPRLHEALDSYQKQVLQSL